MQLWPSSDEPATVDLAGMPPQADAALRRRLLARVRASVQAHREYTTVRREQGAWAAVAPGAERRVLWQGPWLRAQRLWLQPGATLPWPDGVRAQELLVLGGELHAGGQVLRRLDHLVDDHANGRPWRAGPLGAQLYLRERLTELEALERTAPLEAHWWRLAAPGRVARVDGRRWHASGPGVQVARLAGDADVVSMLVRFEPGAAVPDHRHAIDEDCLVIEGEMFLGDVLLRADDFQLAPAGGTHWGETSDVGCLFWFHGAIDPVLKAPL